MCESQEGKFETDKRKGGKEEKKKKMEKKKHRERKKNDRKKLRSFCAICVWCAGTFIGVRALAPVRSCMHLV